MNGIFYYSKKYVFYSGIRKDVAYDYLNFPIKTKFKVENAIHGKTVEKIESILMRLL